MAKVNAAGLKGRLGRNPGSAVRDGGIVAGHELVTVVTR